MPPVIKVENLSKKYRLGVISAGTLRDDVQRWWHRVRRLPDPLARVDVNGQIGGPGRRATEGASGVAGGQAVLASGPDRRPTALQESSETLWALRDVSFEVNQGEVLGIIGRNGAGKSTLLKLMSRVTAPTGGTIRVRGRIASLLEVGTGFHPELTGRENILLNGAIYGMSRADVRRKIDEIIDFSEVERFIDTPVKRYSSGMYVRLAFAVAAHLDPEVLIIDEVLAVGDAEFQAKCLGKIEDVASGGRTVCFVSHNMGAVQQFCTRVLHIEGGKLKASGSSSEMVSAYLASGALDGGDVDLCRHVARDIKKHREIIRRARIYSERGELTQTIFCGERLTVDMVCAFGVPIGDVRFALAIETATGIRVATFANYMHGQSFRRLDGEVVIRCVTQPLALAPGRYLLSFSVATREDGLLDSVDGACGLHMQWRGNYASGEVYTPAYGLLLTDSQWSSVGYSEKVVP